MKRVIFSIILLFFMTCSLIYAFTPRLIVNSGHNKQVYAISYNEKYQLLFSGGDDGTIRIWDCATGVLTYSLQVSSLTVEKIAINPVYPHIAVVETDNISTYRLTVWNWETNEKLFSHKLNDVPLFLKYSPNGSFILYSKTDWESLAFLDSKKGDRLLYLTEGFGIVSAAFISSSGKTLLTYSPSGYIQYWDINNGKQKKKINTTPNLTKIVFTDTGRYMAGSNGEELFLIDLTTGKIKDSVIVINIIDTAISNNEIICYSMTNNKPQLNLFDIKETRLKESPLYLNIVPDSITDILFTTGTIYASLQSGIILSWKPSNKEAEIFSENRLLEISDFAINDRYAVFSSPDKVITLNAGIFLSTGNISALRNYQTSLFVSPVSGDIGITGFTRNKFILWSKDGYEGAFSVFDPEIGFDSHFSGFSAPFISFIYNNNIILTLNKNGTCQIVNPYTGEIEFDYSSFGLRSITFVNDSNIITGRSKTSDISTPLLHINPITGETVSVYDSDILIFDLDYDPVTRKLYSLGIEKRRNGLCTVLKTHTGSTFEQSETLLAYPGEDHSASFAIDYSSSKVFTSLGFGAIKMLSWGGFTSFKQINHISKKMFIFKDLLFSLNKDSSISLLDKNTGKITLDFYIFKDLSWMIIYPTGEYFSTSGADKYLTVFKNQSVQLLDKKEYRQR